MILGTGLLQGGMIGAGGAVAGSGFALAAITMINRFFPIRLESSVYWVDTLPGKMQPVLVASIIGVTVAACLAASILPALRAVSISPSEAVRYE
jgi:ABC-type lipoprotein release transport system permease subunit